MPMPLMSPRILEPVTESLACVPRKGAEYSGTNSCDVAAESFARMVAKNVDMVDDLVVFFFFLVLGLACKGATIGPSCAWVFRSCPSIGRGKACMVSVVGGAAAAIPAGADEGYEAGAEAGATVDSTGSDARMRAGIAVGADTGAGAA